MSDLQANPADPKSVVRTPSLFEHIQFAISVVFLLIIIWLGNSEEKNQYNPMFLTLLSLACGAFFVFLPVSATLDLRWLKATGGAAIFGAIMFMTVPNAQRHNDKHDSVVIENIELASKNRTLTTNVNDFNNQNAKLIVELNLATKQINDLRQENIKQANVAGQNGNNEACNQQITTFLGYFRTAQKQLADVKGAADNASRLALAAASNTSDVQTCTLRGSQAAQALKIANDNISLTDQTVAAAIGAAQQ